MRQNHNSQVQNQNHKKHFFFLNSVQLRDVADDDLVTTHTHYK